MQSKLNEVIEKMPKSLVSRWNSGVLKKGDLVYSEKDQSFGVIERSNPKNLRIKTYGVIKRKNARLILPYGVTFEMLAGNDKVITLSIFNGEVIQVKKMHSPPYFYIGFSHKSFAFSNRSLGKEARNLVQADIVRDFFSAQDINYIKWSQERSSVWE